MIVADTEGERLKVERLLSGVTILALDERAGHEAAEIRRTLELQGNAIGMADYLIAGICIANAATLLTPNRGHFERVTQLTLGDCS